MTTQLLLFAPVIHRGYDRLFDEYGQRAEVLLVGESFAPDYPEVRKEIRALRPQRVLEYLTATGLAPRVRVVEVGDLPGAVDADVLVVPDEELTRDLVDRFDLASRVREVRVERTFLRWDRRSVLAEQEPRPKAVVGLTDLQRELAGRTRELAEHSSDWWRQVGALAARDREVLATAYNHHLPTEYAPYVDGDPRNSFHRGLHIDLSTALHAEAAVVAAAARDGLSLAGADLYVSTFPCPGCARLVAAAGIARCFYAGGYSMLDGERILDEGGVRVVHVDLDAAVDVATGPADRSTPPAGSR
ncbi:deoxycytidylate deaminase [Phycicoccus flavus]|uniref:deoxycytidylate deaminase n=1 Tax=Phycicoccus flavus TaxID=2502783 RepID=UPI000FEBACA5|nr:deaminase [Phycicoccus flavus]NHA69339.1 deoxycytidylate deaminase [Phycicoccus flavus]